MIICTLPRADWRRSFQTVPEPRERALAAERRGAGSGPIVHSSAEGSRALEARVPEVLPGSKRSLRTHEALLGIEVPAPV